MRTDFETLKALANYTINFLAEQKLIEFAMEDRLALIEKLATEYSVSFATDEDIRDQAVEEVEDKLGADNLPEDVTETEMYNHAKKEIIKSFNGETLAGLYLVESLHQTGNRVKDFLLNCDLVDDVFATDEDLVQSVVQHVRHFAPKKTIPQNQ